MREIIEDLAAWWAEGTRFAVATVVEVSGSAPRQVGAAMALSDLGVVAGSVSGGCVEADVYDAAKHVLHDGQAQLLHFGPDDDFGAPGLTCGGSLGVLVRAVDRDTFPAFPVLVEAVRAQQPVALATVVDGPATRGTHLLVSPTDAHSALDDPALEAAAVVRARGMLDMGTTALAEVDRCLGDDTHVQLLVETFAPLPKLIVLGAVDYSAALARLGRFLGYHVLVCDARPAFTTPARFPGADEVVVRWPHELLAETSIDSGTAICVLTHDPKFDVPALVTALASPASFVGAMGSRRTHDDRMARLREAGVPEEQLARLSSPIGLDLGACTPEETAVAILAEVIAHRRGGTGQRLSDVSTPIHH